MRLWNWGEAGPMGEVVLVGFINGGMGSSFDAGGKVSWMQALGSVIFGFNGSLKRQERKHKTPFGWL